ncbi:hypothetical protein BKA70DRAFT_1230069 [Coprinopsis sp. MPI-PUGE-AT-0042]|nr:hypothetical protein BKA70DRAFT_1230069 [Coprinopsis sp. MPI-PUGE-AT-0042]
MEMVVNEVELKKPEQRRTVRGSLWSVKKASPANEFSASGRDGGYASALLQDRWKLFFSLSNIQATISHRKWLAFPRRGVLENNVVWGGATSGKVNEHIDLAVCSNTRRDGAASISWLVADWLGFGQRQGFPECKVKLRRAIRDEAANANAYRRPDSSSNISIVRGSVFKSLNTAAYLERYRADPQVQPGFLAVGLLDPVPTAVRGSEHKRHEGANPECSTGFIGMSRDRPATFLGLDFREERVVGKASWKTE